MGAGHPSEADTRRAVREAVRAWHGWTNGTPAPEEPSGAAGRLILAAVSGGPDSLALAAALAAEAPGLQVRAGAVIVDHGLQAGSASVAARAAAQCEALGLTPVEVVAVTVPDDGSGPEAAARSVRYAALADAADRLGAGPVLLGHTRDDQAEQVLLGLLRGSGARALAGMPPARGRYLRPFLDLPRATTEAACAAAGLDPWRDPHNADPAYTRVRARRALAALARDLGTDPTDALARTASLVRVDADHLDALADEAARDLDPADLTVAQLQALPEAVRTRVWRRLLIAAGAPAGQVSFSHVTACDRLLTHWTGQGPIHVPGPLRVRRLRGRLSIYAPPRVQ